MFLFLWALWGLASQGKQSTKQNIFHLEIKNSSSEPEMEAAARIYWVPYATESINKE